MDRSGESMNPKDKHADWLLKPTANELADELDNMLNAIGLTDNRVPTMLRQQQAEIEMLKKELIILRKALNKWT